MIRNSTFPKVASSSLIVAFAVSLLAGLAVPRPSQAILLNVPVSGDGGGFQRVENIGTIATIELNKDQKAEQIAKAASIAALNSAFQFMTAKLNDTMEDKLGIKNFLYYQDALVEGKYLVDSWSKENGTDAIPVNCRTSSDANCVASSFEALPLKDMSPAAARALAVQTGRTGPDRNRQLLIVGASSLYTSGISCAPANNSLALQRAADYLAASSAGFTVNEINPASGALFYEQMAKLGTPEASPEFWRLGFQDLATTNEGKARAAAELEITSPGLKSTQTVGGVAGGTKIQRSLNLVTVGQQGANQGLFNFASKWTDSTYDTSSFSNFIRDIITKELSSWAAEQISRLVGRSLSGFGFGLKAADLTAFKTFAESSARVVAGNLVNNFATGLYNQVSRMIFQGEILGEISGCRQTKTLNQFSGADTTFTSSGSAAVPAFGDAAAPGLPPPPVIVGQLLFQATQTTINSGEQAVLTWDAGALGSGVTVILNGGQFFNQVVETSGSRTVAPLVTTIYTLTASGQGGTQSVSRTVNVNPLDPAAQVQFDVQPRVVPLLPLILQGTVTVTWNADSIPGADVQIFPLSTSSLPSSGLQNYTVTGPMTFVLTVVDPSGVNADIFRQIQISTIAP